MGGDDYLTRKLSNKLVHGRLRLWVQMGFGFLEQRDHLWTHTLISSDPKLAKRMVDSQRSEASAA